jgi:hypothetical protein
MFTGLAIITIILILVVITALGYFFVRPKMLHWGTTPVEVDLYLAGDELILDPLLLSTRAITIKTNPERVWPWLAQMGQGRGGFYSYEWVENLFGLDIHNADRILPELQDLKIGDLIPFWQGGGVRVLKVEPASLLMLGGTLVPGRDEDRLSVSSDNLGGTWVFALLSTNFGDTRLLVRARVAKFPPKWLSIPLCWILIEPAHFFMERGMLYGIRRRAEMG